MNKNFITNITAIIIILASYFTPIFADNLLMTGLFALSGSITNFLAIHMLFEKIPFLYGSGIIPARFAEFKLAIKKLILTEFFNQQNIEKFLQDKPQQEIEKLTKNLDYEKIYQDLQDAILNSSLGNVIAMMGGKEVLTPLKDPVISKLQDISNEILDEFNDKQNQDIITSKMIAKIENIIDQRLIELTPEMVKNIIQNIIKEHLGWLVVWGGVFGGLIGLSVSFIN